MQRKTSKLAIQLIRRATWERRWPRRVSRSRHLHGGYTRRPALHNTQPQRFNASRAKCYQEKACNNLFSV